SVPRHQSGKASIPDRVRDIGGGRADDLRASVATANVDAGIIVSPGIRRRLVESTYPADEVFGGFGKLFSGEDEDTVGPVRAGHLTPVRLIALPDLLRIAEGHAGQRRITSVVQVNHHRIQAKDVVDEAQIVRRSLIDFVLADETRSGIHPLTGVVG